MKLRAFTLVELLVAMILTGIVVGFGYGAYLLVSNHMGQFKTQKKQETEAIAFRSVLGHDMSVASQVLLQDDSLVLLNQKHRFIYTFDTAFACRHSSSSVDTFFVRPSGFTSHPALPDAESSLIAELGFYLEIQEQKEYVVFRKEYDAQTLLKERSIPND